ncbi:MAG: hypothetical protein AAF211_16040 [Myxococcota bacterium]
MKNVLGFLVLVSAIGCESDGAREFVGVLEGTDSRFGLAIDGDRGQVYVCGGEVDRARHHDWFDVEDSDEGFVGSTNRGSVRLEVDGDVVTGSVTIDDETFVATGTRAQGVDGVFEPDRIEGACRMGTIVTDGGATVQGVFCPEEGLGVQVIPIDEPGPALDGFDVETLTDPPILFSMTPVFSGG